jgi:hypothetical protein
MEIALFLDEDYIKEMSFLDENVDVKLLGSVIMEAQDIHIHPLIGSGLYNEIKAQIIAGTLTALNTTLLNDYLAKSLKWWVFHEGIDVLNFKFTNKSVMKRTSESGNAVEVSDIKRLSEKFKNKAEWYDKRVVEYLCENDGSYPLYNNPGTTADTIHPKRNAFTSGLYLGGSRKPIDKADLYENPNYFN